MTQSESTNSERKNQTHELLHRAGPHTTSELDGSPKVDTRRLYDIWSFNPDERTEAVWYIADEHTDERVLRRWLVANRETIQRVDLTQKALTYALSGSMLEAWQDIRTEDEYDWLTTSEHTSTESESEAHDCPNCDDGPFKNLPRHLRNCDGDS